MTSPLLHFQKNLNCVYCLAGLTNKTFLHVPKEILTWKYRGHRIVQEIIRWKPDVVCLQEVDVYNVCMCNIRIYLMLMFDLIDF